MTETCSVKTIKEYIMEKSNVNYYIIKIVCSKKNFLDKLLWFTFFSLYKIEHVDLAIEILERMINLLNLRIKTLLDLRRQP